MNLILPLRKSFVLLNGAVLSFLLASASSVFALTPVQDEVAQKLDRIPVFAVGEIDNATNTLSLLRLIFSNEGGSEALITPIYLNPRDAETSFQQLQTSFQELQTESGDESAEIVFVDIVLDNNYQLVNPQQIPLSNLNLQEALNLVVVSMGEIYRILGNDQTIDPNFLFIPDRQMQSYAFQILEAQGVENLEERRSFIPVSWMSIRNSAGQFEPLPLTRTTDGESTQFIPIFFNPILMQQEFAQLLENSPELESLELQPQIVDFATLLNTLTNQENANDPNLQQFLNLAEFIPLIPPSLEAQE